MPEDVIGTWVLGDTYHPLIINILINCLNFLIRQDSTGPEGVVCRCLEQDIV